mmetsp:Transcript_5783/g.21037  ORF Transcript_5783/g.21037 Transcript_5783/m.21037 type:complete len:298 (+) Transcript_5783:1235-2128(+)
MFSPRTTPLSKRSFPRCMLVVGNISDRWPVSARWRRPSICGVIPIAIVVSIIRTEGWTTRGRGRPDAGKGFARRSLDTVISRISAARDSHVPPIPVRRLPIPIMLASRSLTAIASVLMRRSTSPIPIPGIPRIPHVSLPIWSIHITAPACVVHWRPSGTHRAMRSIVRPISRSARFVIHWLSSVHPSFSVSTRGWMPSESGCAATVGTQVCRLCTTAIISVSPWWARALPSRAMRPLANRRCRLLRSIGSTSCRVGSPVCVASTIGLRSLRTMSLRLESGPGLIIRRLACLGRLRFG